MRLNAEERLKAKHRQQSPVMNPIDIVMASGFSLSFGVGSADRQDIGETKSVRIPATYNGQRSKLI